MLKIEDGIPAPTKRVVSKGYAEVVRKLAPGQSVLLPLRKANAVSLLSYLYNKRVTNISMRHGATAIRRGEYRYAVEGEGTRIWRVSES